MDPAALSEEGKGARDKERARESRMHRGIL